MDAQFCQTPSATKTVERSERLTTTTRLLVRSRTHADPPPFLDVLSFQSCRLLPQSQKERTEHELQIKKSQEILTHLEKSSRQVSDPLICDEEADQLDKLLSSVQLLLEPIQLPDLSHTKVFGPLSKSVTSSVSLVKPKGGSPANRKLNNCDETTLFYPTGAKNTNMRDYIKETIQKHFPLEKSARDKSRMTSPIFQTPSEIFEFDGQLFQESPSKVRSSGNRVKAKSRLKGIKAPLKASLTPGASLNPHLTKQAKDVIAALRANSSKINGLVFK